MIPKKHFDAERGNPLHSLALPCLHDRIPRSMNVFRNRWPLDICLVLAAATAFLYGQVCTFEFINHDDPEYVSENPREG
jgi:hypothetical protein